MPDNPLIKQLVLIWPALVAFVLFGLCFVPNATFLRLLRPLQFIVQVLANTIHVDLKFIFEAAQNPGSRKIIFIAVGFALLIFVPFRDYEGYFPKEFSISVYFDSPKLEEALKDFDETELRQLNLDRDWSRKREQYFARLDAELNAHQLPFRFMPLETLRGAGAGYITATAIDGWQNYQIADAAGCIQLTRDATPPLTLRTQYTLRSSPANFISVGAFDIYLMRPRVIMPEFDQSVILKPTDTPLKDHILIGATKLRFLPLIAIGKTLYLYTQEDGTRIPIGYAIYSPSSGFGMYAKCSRD